MVTGRDDVVGLDSSVILPAQVWEASGHVEVFTDPLVECSTCHKRFRADHLIEAYEEKQGPPARERPRRHQLPELRHPGRSGPSRESSPACSRPTSARSRTSRACTTCARRPRRASSSTSPTCCTTVAQEAAVRHRPDRQELPQRDHAGQLHLPHPRVRADGDGVLRQAGHGRGVAPVLDRRSAGTGTPTSASTRRTCGWYEHPQGEALATTPSAPSTSSTASASRQRVGRARGRREPHRLRPDDALRGTPAPTCPTSTRTKDERWTPYVIEPAAGLDPRDDGVPARRLRRGRGAQHQGRRRQAHRAAAGPAAGAGQGRRAAAVPQRASCRRRPATSPRDLRKHWNVEFDDAGAIGRRYRRQDEIGTPFCVTVDFETLDDKAVTVRERDTMTQERVSLDQVEGYLAAEQFVA